MTTKTKTFINAEVVHSLPRRNLQVYDTEITGFAIRCRATGGHSYRMTIARGRVVTLGKVSKKPQDGGITAADARAAALQLKQGTVLAALHARAADPALTLAEAKVQAQTAVDARRQSRAVRAMTLGAYLTDPYGPWVTEQRKTGDEELARLQATFTDLLATPLPELSAFAIERWRTARLKTDGVKPITTNRDLSALRGALSRAVEWGLLAAHPMKTVKDAKTDPIGHIRYLSETETRRLRLALAARDDRRRIKRASHAEWRRERDREPCAAFGRYTDHVTPIVLTALNTGLRRGELLALTWRDLDLLGALLTVRAGNAKSAKTRVVPLNTEAVHVLRAWRPAVADLDAPVFPGAAGEPLKEFKTAWRALMRAAKIDQFRFHDCRHDFASKLVQAGVDLNTVRELLGHRDIKMTLRYAHLAPAHKAAAVARLVSA